MHGQCFWHLLLPRMWAIMITILILRLMTLLKMQLRAFSIYLNWTLFGSFKLTIIWNMTIHICISLHWDVLCSFLPLPLPPVSTQCSKWILSKPGRIKWTNQDSSCYTTQYILQMINKDVFVIVPVAPCAPKCIICIQVMMSCFQ